MPAVRRDYIFLVIVFILLATSTIVWTLTNRTPPSWDPADHMQTAYDFYRPLSLGRFTEFFRELIAPHPYGPLFHWITAAFFLIAGVSKLTGIAANLVGLAILLLSVNWIGAMIQPASAAPPGSARTVRYGVIASLLAACYHFPAWLIHDAFLDYLLTAMVALAFALLIRADKFHVRTDAVLFGIAAGLGFLAKQTFFFFFILPAVFLWSRAILNRDRRAIANLSLSAMVVILIASIWYLPHIRDVLNIYRVNVLNAPVEHEAPLFSFLSLAYYWGVLAGLQIQLLFTSLFIVGVIYSIRRRLQRDCMLYLWILSGILSFTLIANKDTRYTVPILPAVALLSVSWLNGVRPSRRLPAAALVGFWAFVSFFNAQWPSPRLDFRLAVPGTPLYFLAGNVFRFDHRPSPEDWSIPEIVSGSFGRLGVVPNLWQLNPSNVRLYARIHSPQVHVVWLSDEMSAKPLERCDYVLARTLLGNAEIVAPVEKSVAAYLREHSDRFVPVAFFILPGGQEAALYRQYPLLRTTN